MMKSEFIEIAKIKDILDSDYQIIEKVYMWHPSLENVKRPKQKIADLYRNFGMVAIKDMLPRAEKIMELDEEISRKMIEVDKLRQQIKALSK